MWSPARGLRVLRLLAGSRRLPGGPENGGLGVGTPRSRAGVAPPFLASDGGRGPRGSALGKPLLRPSSLAFPSLIDSDPLFSLHPCLPERRVNCFFMPLGCFSPNFFVAVAMATKNPAALYFLRCAGRRGPGEADCIISAGTFLSRHPISLHRARSSPSPQSPGCLSGFPCWTVAPS